MGFPTDNTDTLPSESAPEQFAPLAESSIQLETDSLEDSLRRLRSRQLMMEAVFGAGQLSNDAPRAETEISADASDAQADEEIDEIEEEEPEEPDFDFGAAFDDLRQEIRRLGRELFKTNRTAEGNQGIVQRSA